MTRRTYPLRARFKPEQVIRPRTDTGGPVFRARCGAAGPEDRSTDDQAHHLHIHFGTPLPHYLPAK